MHKTLSTAELAEVQAKHPVAPMSKAEKLAKWADLIEAHPHSLFLYSNLEHWGPQHLGDSHYVTSYPPTAISLALGHDAFKAESIGETVGSAIKFFDLSLAELHEFSCDCGGSISNKEQARRIRNIAKRGDKPTLTKRLSDYIL